MDKVSCSAEGCEKEADFEVRLYDVYLYEGTADLFDKRDSTCPYLCREHMQENERNADGVRKPRGIVSYPYSNKHHAQGFTIYRELEKV